MVLSSPGPGVGRRRRCGGGRSHPALTDLTLDAVAAFEGSVQSGDGVWSVHGV